MMQDMMHKVAIRTARTVDKMIPEGQLKDMLRQLYLKYISVSPTSKLVNWIGFGDAIRYAKLTNGFELYFPLL